jgi:hypothetical protein
MIMELGYSRAAEGGQPWLETHLSQHCSTTPVRRRQRRGSEEDDGSGGAWVQSRAEAEKQAYWYLVALTLPCALC